MSMSAYTQSMYMFEKLRIWKCRYICSFLTRYCNMYIHRHRLNSLMCITMHMYILIFTGIPFCLMCMIMHNVHPHFYSYFVLYMHDHAYVHPHYYSYSILFDVHDLAYVHPHYNYYS